MPPSSEAPNPAADSLPPAASLGSRNTARNLGRGPDRDLDQRPTLGRLGRAGQLSAAAAGPRNVRRGRRFCHSARSTKPEPSQGRPEPSVQAQAASSFGVAVSGQRARSRSGRAGDGLPRRLLGPAGDRPAPGWTSLPRLAPERDPTLGPSAHRRRSIDDPPSNLQPLPDGAPAPLGQTPNLSPPPAPVLTDSQRITTIYPRGLGEIQAETLPEQPDGTQIIVIRNGVNINMRSKIQGLVDIEADSVVIWRRKEGRQGPPRVDFNGQLESTTTATRSSFYLEGHVILRQDQLHLSGQERPADLSGRADLLRRPEGAAPGPECDRSSCSRPAWSRR